MGRRARRPAASIVVVALIGCGGSGASPLQQADVGSDGSTVQPDAPDAAIDSTAAPAATDARSVDAAPMCPGPVPAKYACPLESIPPGSTTCDDVAIDSFVASCFPPAGNTSACVAWAKGHPACNKCTGDWIIGSGYVDVGACYLAIDPTAKECATVVTCGDDCGDAVCAQCPNSAYDDCVTAANQPSGACYSVAKVASYGACASDSRFAPCQVVDTPSLAAFFRAACGANGDFAGARADGGTHAGAGDSGGVDAATDGG
jgi:hypothetical protein